MELESSETNSESSPILGSSRSRIPLFSAAFSASLFVVLFGMVTGYAAPATVDMTKPGSRFRSIITDRDIAWIASAPSLSAILGNILAGYTSHKLGRKAVLMFVSVSFTASWLMVAYAPRLPLVFAGRLTSGLCAGLCSVAVPAYIVEIATVETRGMLSTGFQLSFAIGVFLEIALGIFLRWSWLAVFGATIVIFATYLMVCMPESPPWLVKMSRHDEGMEALRFLRGNAAAKEFRDISESLTEEPENGLSLRELLRPELYKPLAISVSLMFFQQFAGINGLMAYSVRIFQDAQSGLEPTVAAAIVALVQILATIPSGLLMDKKGRRLLFMLSGTCIALSLAAAGIHSQLSGRGEWTWVPVVTLITYMIGFSIGFGPIPFVVMPEIVPLHSRSFVIAVASVTNSFFSFVVIQTFDDLRGFLGMAGVYWIYAGVAIIGVLFYWRFVPETKGRTLREIHQSFSLRPDH